MLSVDLIVDLPPPRSIEGVSLDLSPSAYIHHPNTLNLLCRNTSLQIGPQTHKKCRLEPAPIENDRTILQYYDRVHQSVFKEEMSVRIPGESIVKTLNDGKIQMEDLAATEEQNKSYGERIFVLESQITTLLKYVQEHDEARLRLFRANTLADLVKKVFMDLKLNYPGNLDEVKDTKKMRTAHAALSLNQRQLESFFKDKGKTLGPQYFKVLQNINQYIDGRNETAHETSTEFAVLLSSDRYNKTREYYKWANLFPYVYGKSVVEIAEGRAAAVQNQNAEDVEWGPV